MSRGKKKKNSKKYYPRNVKDPESKAKFEGYQIAGVDEIFFNPRIKKDNNKNNNDNESIYDGEHTRCYRCGRIIDGEIKFGDGYDVYTKEPIPLCSECFENETKNNERKNVEIPQSNKINVILIMIILILLIYIIGSFMKVF